MTGKVDRDYQLELLQQAKEANVRQCLFNLCKRNILVCTHLQARSTVTCPSRWRIRCDGLLSCADKVKAQVIVYLETGTGKTRIAALLIKHFLNTVDELARPDDESQTAENPKNVIFLVPAVILVAQQAVQVNDVVNGKQKAGMYNGDKGVDAWDRARWTKEFQCAARQLTLMPHCLLACVQPKSCALRRMHCCSADFINFDCAAFCFRALARHVMAQCVHSVGRMRSPGTGCREHPVAVMMPAVLEGCLRRGDIVMGSIALLIFDEAHHCNKHHPYNQVMDHYRQARLSERPRIFGMTACPVNTKVRPSGHHRMSGC